MADIFRRLVDGIFTIKDQDAFRNVKSLAINEGLLVGSSSGEHDTRACIEFKRNYLKVRLLSYFQMVAIDVATNI